MTDGPVMSAGDDRVIGAASNGQAMGASVNICWIRAVNYYPWARLWKDVGLCRITAIHYYTQALYTEQNNDEDYAAFDTKNTEW